MFFAKPQILFQKMHNITPKEICRYKVNSDDNDFQDNKPHEQNTHRRQLALK